MKQTARERKTRKEKIDTEKRKIEKELAELDKLEKQLKEEQVKLYNKQDRLHLAEGILKMTSALSLAITGAMVFTLGLGNAISHVDKENDIDDAIYEYMDSAEYEEIKAGCIKEYYHDYENGQISTNEFVDKVEDLDSFDYVKEHYLQEEQKAIGEKREQERLDAAYPYANVAVVSAILTGTTFLAGKIVEKKGKQAEKEHDATRGKELQLSNKITKKKEELLELE
ncbi:MAG: hypothetical protein IJZ62_01480 [Clostridia bacterium]|nr:hypothetical protein [Clostridia bacterium]